jgi:hypothetical protein
MVSAIATTAPRTENVSPRIQTAPVRKAQTSSRTERSTIKASSVRQPSVAAATQTAREVDNTRLSPAASAVAGSQNVAAASGYSSAGRVSSGAAVERASGSSSVALETSGAVTGASTASSGSETEQRSGAGAKEGRREKR